MSHLSPETQLNIVVAGELNNDLIAAEAREAELETELRQQREEREGLARVADSQIARVQDEVFFSELGATEHSLLRGEELVTYTHALLRIAGRSESQADQMAEALGIFAQPKDEPIPALISEGGDRAVQRLVIHQPSEEKYANIGARNSEPGSLRVETERLSPLTSFHLAAGGGWKTHIPEGDIRLAVKDLVITDDPEKTQSLKQSPDNVSPAMIAVGKEAVMAAIGSGNRHQALFKYLVSSLISAQGTVESDNYLDSSYDGSRIAVHREDYLAALANVDNP